MKISAWSFSRWSLYEQCPLKLRLSVIDKIKEPSSPAMDRGTDIHKLAEEYLRGIKRTVPKELHLFSDEMKRLRAIVKRDPATKIEETWAFRNNWVTTTWDDWDGAWLRVKLDLAHFEGNALIITDWKTGKFRQDSADEYQIQLELYALAALIIYADRPDLVVLPRLVYTDQGIVYPGDSTTARDYTPRDLPLLKKTWLARTKPMLRDKTFAPKPNRFCGWCHYRNSNKANGGGQCLF